jgi:hypothetical protein
MYYIFRKCVFVALGTQREMRMRTIVNRGLSGSKKFFHINTLFSLFPPPPPKKKVTWIENVCFDFLYKFIQNISHSKKTEGDIIKNAYWYSRKVPAILVRFQWNLNFLDIFSKSTIISNFIKIRPVRAELFYTDRKRETRQTDGQAWRS